MTNDIELEQGWRSARHQVNGVTLHAVEAGPADGPLVILLHGFPEYWWGWRKQIGPLAAAGFRVVAPDMRGYNESDAPAGLGAYRADVLAADVVGLADAFGAERFGLVGHDWGGIVAWEVAGCYPERLDRLVVMNAPHPDTMLRQMVEHPTQILRSAYVGFFQLPLVPEAVLSAGGYASLRRAMRDSARPGAFSTSDLDRYAAAWAKPGRLTAMLNYYRALGLRRSGAAARISVPTFVLWGENDTALEEHLAHAAMERCDQGRLRIVHDATHWLHHEQPAEVNERLIGYLRSGQGG